MYKYLVFNVLFVFFGGMVFAEDVREIPFNDKWEFVKGDCQASDAFEKGALEWQSVAIPHTWNDKDAYDGTGNIYTGIACYRKTLTLSEGEKDKRHYIRFEGVGTIAEVYVNDLLVGKHEGAFSAFCFEITDALKADQPNEIFVRADNAPRKSIIPVNNRLFMVYGGIYRPISLITTDMINITPTDFASPGIYIKQDKVSRKKAEITVTSKLTNAHASGQKLTLLTTIFDKDGCEVAANSKEVFLKSTVATAFEQKISVDSPILWHGRKNPYLYSLTVQVMQDGKELDAVTQPLGLRFYRVDPEIGFILNDEPYRLHGVCRHQDWEGYGAALSREQHKIDCDYMYEIGATSLRLAHYQQADDMYEFGDKLGFLIWAEIPFVNTWTGEEGANAKQQMREMIRQNYNHPSIFVWGLHNEVYAKHSMQFPVQLTKDLHDIGKSEDPDRFTVSVSGFGSMNRDMDCHADLMGCNRYFGWYYGRMDEMGAWLDGTREVRPNNPTCVAEYGAGGNVFHQEENPKRPAAGGEFFPEQYQTEFHEVSYAHIKARPFSWTSYVWNMFDFAMPYAKQGGIKGRNHKGLITFDRKIKKDSFFFYKANWSEEPVLHLAGKRLKVQSFGEIEIKAYSNCKKLKLVLNGKKMGAQAPDSVNIFRWPNLSLKNGENTVRVTGTYKGEKLTDSYTFTYDAEKRKREISARKKLLTSQFVNAKASEEDQGHIAEHAADDNPKTFWSAMEKNGWLRLDLDEERELSELLIHWYAGSSRKYDFTVSYSTDSNSWIEVYKGVSSGKIKGMEKISFPPVKTRYIKITGMGSNASPWTNIIDVKIPANE